MIVARRWVGGQKLTNEFPPWYSTVSSSSSSTASSAGTRRGKRRELADPNEAIRKRSSYWPFVAGGTDRLENAHRGSTTKRTLAIFSPDKKICMNEVQHTRLHKK